MIFPFEKIDFKLCTKNTLHVGPAYGTPGGELYAATAIALYPVVS